MQLFQAASCGTYSPRAEHMSSALVSMRNGPLWDASLATPVEQEQQPRKDRPKALARRNMCAALLHACQQEFAGPCGASAAGGNQPAGGVQWATHLSVPAQLVLLRVLRQLGNADDFALLCLLVDWRQAPQVG